MLSDKLNQLEKILKDFDEGCEYQEYLDSLVHFCIKLLYLNGNEALEKELCNEIDNCLVTIKEIKEEMEEDEPPQVYVDFISEDGLSYNINNITPDIKSISKIVLNGEGFVRENT